MSLQDALLFLLALLAIVNPVGSVVLFASLAGRFARSVQQRMANQSALAVLIILLVCAWVAAISCSSSASACPCSRRRAWPSRSRSSSGSRFVLRGGLAQRLGPIGLNIVTRVMGILVTAIAFGLLAHGIGGLLPGLAR